MAESRSGDSRPTAAQRGVLHQNRDFFDQFFTRVVRRRFEMASDESAARLMSIIVGSCNAARCQLTANNHLLVLTAARMATTQPEITVACIPPEGSSREGLRSALRYQPPAGWLESSSQELVGDLTTWLGATIASFLEWSAGVPS